MSDYGDKESILKSNLIKPDKSKIAHQKNTVCLGGPCTVWGPKIDPPTFLEYFNKY